MKVAIVTPHWRTPVAVLNQCLRSVAAQGCDLMHFLVCDGDELPEGTEGLDQVQVIRLARSHGDAGNVARAVGSVCAIGQGFDAIAYLDSDNWYEPEHLSVLIAMHLDAGAAVCTSGRTLYQPDGTRLGVCPEVDGKKFVDTNCLFLTRQAFPIVSQWYLTPRRAKAIADRFVWKAIKHSPWLRAHHARPTVNYRTTYRAHFEYFGVAPPPDAKVADLADPD